jgi:hypothetical protein
MKKCIFLVFHLLSFQAFAQPVIEWQRALGGTYLDEAYAGQQTPDGGYILAGYAGSSNGDVTGHHGGIDGWLVKLNDNGSTEWKKALGGTKNEFIYAVVNTIDGGYIAAGMTESSNGNVSGNHGGKDAWVVKISSNGAIQWQKCLGGSGWDEAWDIKQTTDSGYIIAGRTNSTDGDVTGSNGGLDYWVVKLAEDGSIVWQRNYGGTSEDNGYAVIETTDGGYLVVGEAFSVNGDVTNSRGNGDYWVIKLSSNGDLIWEKALGGSYLDRANDVVETPDGGYMIAGSVSSVDGDITNAPGGYDIWLVKLDPSGLLEWEKPYGGTNDDRCNSIRPTASGGYVLGGFTSSNDGDVQSNDGIQELWVLEIDDQGHILWEITAGGSLGERAFFATQTLDGGYFVAGASNSTDGDVTGHHGPEGYFDWWAIKLTPASVSTRTLTTQSLQISPNPASSQLMYTLPENVNPVTVSVADVAGKIVVYYDHANQIIDISQLKKGLYYMAVCSGEGVIYTRKFIKN